MSLVGIALIAITHLFIVPLLPLILALMMPNRVWLACFGLAGVLYFGVSFFHTHVPGCGEYSGPMTLPPSNDRRLWADGFSALVFGTVLRFFTLRLRASGRMSRPAVFGLSAGASILYLFLLFPVQNRLLAAFKVDPYCRSERQD